MIGAREESVVFVELHTRQDAGHTNAGDAFRHPFGYAP